MYSYVTLVFLVNHIRMWSIGQWIAHCMTNKIRYLVGLFVCGTPLSAEVVIFWFLRDEEGIKYRNIIIVITNLTFYSTKLKIIMLIYITTDFARAK